MGIMGVLICAAPVVAPFRYRFFANRHGKRLLPRRGGRGWDVAWGSVSGGDDIPCGRPSSFHRQRRGRPQGSPPNPSPPPPLRGRRFPCLFAKNLYLKGGAGVVREQQIASQLAFLDTPRMSAGRYVLACN